MHTYRHTHKHTHTQTHTHTHRHTHFIYIYIYIYIYICNAFWMNVKSSVPQRNIQNNFCKIAIEAETRSGSEFKYVCGLPCVLQCYI